jgi:adenylylsulfate kinase
VYVKCSLEECEDRDVKGLYKRARAGEIPEFTGISSPYEPPLKAELVVDTEEDTLEECVAQMIKFLEERGIIPNRVV